jgi:hypothetical protein
LFLFKEDDEDSKEEDEYGYLMFIKILDLFNLNNLKINYLMFYNKK